MTEILTDYFLGLFNRVQLTDLLTAEIHIDGASIRGKSECGEQMVEFFSRDAVSLLACLNSDFVCSKRDSLVMNLRKSDGVVGCVI